MCHPLPAQRPSPPRRDPEPSTAWALVAALHLQILDLQWVMRQQVGRCDVLRRLASLPQRMARLR